MDFRMDFGVEDDLGQTKAVADVDKDQPAEIAAAMDPTGQLDSGSGVFGAERTAGQPIEGTGIDVECNGHDALCSLVTQIVENREVCEDQPFQPLTIPSLERSRNARSSSRSG